MTRPVRNILFITWDGPQTSYLEGLFLPIFAQLNKAGYALHVLQFGWGEATVRQQRAAACAAHGIPYRHVPVLRRAGGAGPFLTGWRGARHIRRAVRDWQIDTLMPRSLMPALAVLRLRRAEREALSIVFDADGLAADERVDFGGMSPHGPTYRILRDIEAEMLRRSDAVLCRTEAAKDILIARAGPGLQADACHVVTNGKDVGPFAEALANRSDRQDGFRLCYCGSIGAQYRLPEMLELATFLRERIPDLTFDLYSPASDEIAQALRRMNMPETDWITWRSLSASEVPAALAACDLGLALRQPSFSMQAVLPIKIGEYLLAGVPVAGTPGIGDTEALSAKGVFRSAERMDRHETLRWIIEEVIPERDRLRGACHEVGRERFSVEGSARRYVEALQWVAK